MMMAISIFATVVALLNIFTFRERPGSAIFTKPGHNDTQDLSLQIEHANEVGLLEQLKICLKNKTYLWTGLGTSGIIIHLYLFLTFVGQLVDPYGITDQ